MAVAIAELLRPGVVQNICSGIGFFALLSVAILLLINNRANRTVADISVHNAWDGNETRGVIGWRLTLLGLAVFGLGIAQTWFRSGTAIAGGDIPPPIGTAWIGRIFETYGWSGSNLGGPIANQGQLPWALVDWMVHAAGGSGALAQRIWLTLLIAGVLVAGGCLARSLRMSPLAGVVVGVLFFLNPMTMSQVGTNDVYLVAMGLTAILPAAVIGYGRGTLKLWQICLSFALAAPFVGFSFANPPVIGMLVIVLLATPLLAWARFDRQVAGRALMGLLISGAVAAAVSSYWFIPGVMAITQTAAIGSLSSLSSWGFTESRSTLANGFWLNTTWGWSFGAYYPFAHWFREFPLLLVRALVPVLAFAGLVFSSARIRLHSALQSARLMGLLSVLVLGLVLLSNGTRSPGFLLFDPLYHLPYGWLLQEPGRFLLMAALGYALLIGLLVDSIGTECDRRHSSGVMRIGGLLSWSKRSTLGAVALSVALLASVPLWTGAIVPGPRDGFPSTHVVVPRYWEQAAGYLNSAAAPSGSLLVLPADDFYQMPYSWYYGNDGFIPNLFDRHVVVPSGQGYTPASNELLDAVRIEDTALLSHDWVEAFRILEAIGTRLVLVRGDINSHFPGRTIASPRKLMQALEVDPNMHRVDSFGLLSVYETDSRHFNPPNNYATTSSANPNLNALAFLPPRTALITSSSLEGHATLAKLSPIQTWTIAKGRLSTRVFLPISDRLVVHDVGADGSAFKTSTRPAGRVGGSEVRTVSIARQGLLTGDSEFQRGSWSAVGNCNDAVPVLPGSRLGGLVESNGPFGSRVLTLHASVDAACDSTALHWKTGVVVIRYLARSLAGSAPQMCVWETLVNQCATVASFSSSDVSAYPGWREYSFAVVPSAHARSLSLFLYAYAPSSGGQTIDQYAGVKAVAVSSLTPPILIGVPPLRYHDHLIVSSNTFSGLSTDARGALHVDVDGLRNGWIVKGNPGDRQLSALSSHGCTELHDSIAFATLMLCLAGGLSWTLLKKKASYGKTNG
ncbi:hypothetical protein [Ferrimicrobium sp.]|uniref:hypothetical protein n=1 Tax=Ferrimicrobium sp. TaxID=2926050 RepID=UPI0026298AB6|nr:hypothetical protein [Ferrimicrobium sp.]